MSLNKRIILLLLRKEQEKFRKRNLLIKFQKKVLAEVEVEAEARKDQVQVILKTTVINKKKRTTRKNLNKSKIVKVMKIKSKKN